MGDNSKRVIEKFTRNGWTRLVKEVEEVKMIILNLIKFFPILMLKRASQTKLLNSLVSFVSVWAMNQINFPKIAWQVWSFTSFRLWNQLARTNRSNMTRHQAKSANLRFLIKTSSCIILTRNSNLETRQPKYIGRYWASNKNQYKLLLEAPLQCRLNSLAPS